MKPASTAYATEFFPTTASQVRKGMIVEAEGGQSLVKATAVNLKPGKISLMLTVVGLVHLDPFDPITVVVSHQP